MTSSGRRQRAISRLDKLESVVLALTIAYSIALVGLTGLGVWLNRPIYYLVSVAGSVLAAVLRATWIDLNKRRALLLQQEEKGENSLRILEVAGLIDDPDERMRIIAEYASATMQNLTAREPERAAPRPIRDRGRFLRG
jgi:enoyl reductase-like protein